MMKFCETFRITPLEYYQLPYSLIQLWVQMKNIENGIAKTNQQLAAVK